MLALVWVFEGVGAVGDSGGGGADAGGNVECQGRWWCMLLLGWARMMVVVVLVLDGGI